MPKSTNETEIYIDFFDNVAYIQTYRKYYNN